MNRIHLTHRSCVHAPTRTIASVLTGTVALAIVAATLTLAAPHRANAEVEFGFRGLIDSDLRLAVDADRGPVPDQDPQFFWNRNMFEGEVSIFSGDNIRAFAHARLIYFGLYNYYGAELNTVSDLADRSKIDPFRIDSDSLYVEWRDFITAGLDLRAGRMVNTWGAADLFNPTNNLNPYWLEDPMMFGRKLGNQMLSLTYNVPVEAEWTIEGVVVPVFRPSMLPISAPVGASNPGLAPIANDQLKQALIDETNRQLERGGIVITDPTLRLNNPDFAWDNVAFGLRNKWRVWDTDMSLSYYYGRFTIPVPKRSYTYAGDEVQTPDGIRTEQNTLVDLIYPRMQVVGFDFSRQIPFLGNMGFWGEVGVFIPERIEFIAYLPNYREGDPCAKPGDKAGDITLICSQNTDRVFVKATAGLDYSFTSWLYMNLQYLHGFIDEFGTEALIDDYVVGGFDFKFLDESILLRTFAVYNFQDSSAVLFPSFSYKLYGVTLGTGALIFLGDYDTKFGQKATGRNQVYMRAKFEF